MWGAKLFKRFQPSIPSKTQPAGQSVGTFVGMLFHNGANCFAEGKAPFAVTLLVLSRDASGRSGQACTYVRRDVPSSPAPLVESGHGQKGLRASAWLALVSSSVQFVGLLYEHRATMPPLPGTETIMIVD